MNKSSEKWFKKQDQITHQKRKQKRALCVGKQRERESCAGESLP
jgi:hypothetical protein